MVWADDNADMREYVTRLLEPEFDVVPVADGAGALRAIRDQTHTKTALGAVVFIEEALRWLPDDTRRQAEDVDPAGGAPAEGASGEPRRRIVLADDNADMREYVRRLFVDR